MDISGEALTYFKIYDFPHDFQHLQTIINNIPFPMAMGDSLYSLHPQTNWTLESVKV